MIALTINKRMENNKEKNTTEIYKYIMRILLGTILLFFIIMLINYIILTNSVINLIRLILGLVCLYFLIKEWNKK